MEKLRQPIITVLGHVDHGKTTILDCIRKTTIAEKEPGAITQCIGATNVPASVVEKLCSGLLERFNFKITVPGLLFIDTPGHEAFSSLRRRGGSIADLGVLVVDIIEGAKPQTLESIEILKETKTPFVVAINKVDRIHGWRPIMGASILDSISQQSEFVQRHLDEAFYKVIAQLSKHVPIERFDRIRDFRTTVAAVPTSGKTGEGIPDLLAVLIGLAQTFLRNKLKLTETVKGSVLEVKEMPGLGRTIDVILCDGSIHKGDYLVIGGANPLITRIKALLEPAPLSELRAEKRFQQVDEVSAACGVRIAAPGLNGITAGAPIAATSSEGRAKEIFTDFMAEKQEVEFVTENEGLVLKADNVGSLDALRTIFGKWPVKSATLGTITKEDLMRAETNVQPFHRVIIAFNVAVPEETAKMLTSRGIKLISSNVIYHLIEEYEKWRAELSEQLKAAKLSGITRPGKLKILHGYVFRISNPAIVGCEVSGLVQPGAKLFKSDRGIIGEIKQIQKEGEAVPEAKNGDRVAISIVGPTVGRQIFEGDVLYTDITSEEWKTLKANEQWLSDGEKEVLREIFELKRSADPKYGL
jgi:translation initiation factor 5B